MKSLEDFKQSIRVIAEKEYSSVTYAAPQKVVAVVGPDGKIKWKKQRIGRIVLGASKAGLVNANNTPDTQASAEFSVSDMTNVKESKETKENLTDPPYVLVLKRKSIRLFPNNTKVALYHNAKLNKTFSVPYGPGMNSVIQAESFIEDLNFSEDSKNYMFESGDSITITRDDAKSLLKLYNNLNENNKQKMLNNLCESKDAFNKILQFSISKT
jgi:hypothetical protein